MTAIRKSWQEKLQNSKDLPKRIRLGSAQQKKWGCTTMAIPSPLEVDAWMKKVPLGKLTTINRIRKKIARAHRAGMACPLTTGIFSWIAANAAEEARGEGKKRITPYWRTLKEGGVLNQKFPGGMEQQSKLLGSEGHRVEQRGKKWVVAEAEKKMTG